LILIFFDNRPKAYNLYQYRVQGTRYRVQGTGYKVQGTRYRVQGTRYRVQGTGYKVQGTGYRGNKYFENTHHAEGLILDTPEHKSENIKYKIGYGSSLNHDLKNVKIGEIVQIFCKNALLATFINKKGEKMDF
jgi:hypothetical protein